jgi:Fur family transcriptional regulator, stress-responsive regulator
MDDLMQRLRRRRWPLTAQRRAVAEVLAGEHVHLSADEVHRLAAARLPEVSRATVYKTLAQLVAMGELREVSVGGRAKRYDPNHDAGHQHLVCERCGTTRDVHPHGSAALRLAKPERYGFTLTGVDVVFRGLCPACAKAAATGRRKRRA